MTKRTYLILIAILILIFTAYYYHTYKNGESNVLTLFGNVDVRQVDLGFRVSGRVDKMFYEEGDWVKAGSLAGKLDKDPYEDQVRQAKAAWESAKISWKNAESNYNRRVQLAERGGVSKEDLDNARTSMEVADYNLKQAKAALGVAETNLNDTEVYAPIDGTILTRIREPGSVVKPADAIYTLSITNPVWIRAYVSEPDLGLIYPGMEAEIYTDTPTGKVYKGNIGFISPIAEFTPKNVETTRLRTDLVYRIRVYAENPDQGLRQGMPVTLKLPLNQDKDRERK